MRSLNRAVTFSHQKEKPLEFETMKHLKKLEDEVTAWPHISVHPHRFGGKEFLSEVQKSGTYMLAGSLTSRFRDQFAMRSWSRSASIGRMYRATPSAITAWRSLFVRQYIKPSRIATPCGPAPNRRLIALP